MKKTRFYLGILGMATLVFVLSCSAPVNMTSWKNPDDHSKVSKLVVIPLFAKLEYVKPFEQSMVNYFNQQGLKSMGSLDFLNPSKQYTVAQVRAKVDSLGADAVLVFKYTGTDKEASYVPATYYAGYGGGYWGWGYGGGVYSGGYWSTTSTVNVKALLYNVKNTDGAIWTADVSVTDPEYVDQIATQLAQKIFADWKNYGLLNPVTGK